MYRDGVELEPMMNDENYDFNFQETRKLKEERIIKAVSISKQYNNVLVLLTPILKDCLSKALPTAQWSAASGL